MRRGVLRLEIRVGDERIQVLRLDHLRSTLQCGLRIAVLPQLLAARLVRVSAGLGDKTIDDNFDVSATLIW